MGHLINPLSYRLSNVRYWNHNWFSSINYHSLLSDNLLLNLFIKRVFYLLKLNTLGFIFINFKIVRSFSKTAMYIYIHDSFLDTLVYEWKKSASLKFIKGIIKRKFLYSLKNKTNSFFYTKKKTKFVKKNYFNILFSFFTSIFFQRKVLTLFWGFVKIILYRSLLKIQPKLVNSQVFLIGMSKYNVTANVVSEFFYVRLKQYYTIWEVLRTVNYLFKQLRYKFKIIKGYKIIFSGRFSRKQRATYSWKTFGSIAPSSMKSKLDYQHISVALKYSLCTVRIWIRLNKTNYHNLDFII